MGLKVWLPLNGDLTQQGTSGVSVVNNNATVNTNGKIGSCYAFNGSNQYLYTNYNFYFWEILLHVHKNKVYNLWHINHLKWQQQDQPPKHKAHYL